MTASNSKLDEAIHRLSSNDTSLTALDLELNDVGDEGAGRLAKDLAINSSLTSLDLEMNEVGKDGARWLAEIT